MEARTRTAQAANEYRHHIGQDLNLSFESGEWEEEEAADLERWEAEGRAELYSMLGLAY